MPVFISLLKGVNLAGHRKVKMEDLRALYESLGFENVQTYINSGNVIFRTSSRNAGKLRSRIEDAIEHACGFRTQVMLRTPAEVREVIARSPFAARKGIDGSKLAVHFLADELSTSARQQLLAMDFGPEELHVEAWELHVYYTNGMARPRLSMAQVERMMKTVSTARNWNTVRKLLEMAEKLEPKPSL